MADPTPADAAPLELPFAPGETLSYAASIGRFGKAGKGTMRVAGEDRLRGRRVFRLEFEFGGRVALMRLRDRTASWLDPERMASLRYRKDERHPLGSRHEAVEIYPDEARWEGAGGAGGDTPSPDPLDELSFLYFVRTLELEPGEVRELDRHFDAERSPVRVRGGEPERVRVGAGTFEARTVEMLVRDPDRFGGRGRILLHLSRDRPRTPVRIETSMPVAGSLVLELARRIPGV